MHNCIVYVYICIIGICLNNILYVYYCTLLVFMHQYGLFIPCIFAVDLVEDGVVLADVLSLVLVLNESDVELCAGLHDEAGDQDEE